MRIGARLGDRALVTGFALRASSTATLHARRGRASRACVYFNSAAVIDGVSGVPRLSQIYDKHHLVPFGEYIPFWSLVSAQHRAAAAHRRGL